MNMIINFMTSKVAAPVWNFLDGKKLYGTGAITILGAVLGLAAQLAPILAAHDTAGLIAFLSHVNSDPAWIALMMGFGTIAGAHKMEKAATPSAPAAPSEPQP